MSYTYFVAKSELSGGKCLCNSGLVKTGDEIPGETSGLLDTDVELALCPKN